MNACVIDSACVSKTNVLAFSRCCVKQHAGSCLLPLLSSLGPVIGCCTVLLESCWHCGSAMHCMPIACKILLKVHAECCSQWSRLEGWQQDTHGPRAPVKHTAPISSAAWPAGLPMVADVTRKVGKRRNCRWQTRCRRRRTRAVWHPNTPLQHKHLRCRHLVMRLFVVSLQQMPLAGVDLTAVYSKTAHMTLGLFVWVSLCVERHRHS